MCWRGALVSDKVHSSLLSHARAPAPDGWRGHLAMPGSSQKCTFEATFIPERKMCYTSQRTTFCLQHQLTRDAVRGRLPEDSVIWPTNSGEVGLLRKAQMSTITHVLTCAERPIFLLAIFLMEKRSGEGRTTSSLVVLNFRPKAANPGSHQCESQFQIR